MIVETMLPIYIVNIVRFCGCIYIVCLCLNILGEVFLVVITGIIILVPYF